MKKLDIKKTIIFAIAVFIATLSGALMPLSDGAYIHIGDAAIYIAALMLPTPFACVAAAVGACAADIVLGSGIYLIPTLIIKPLTVCACALLSRLSKDESVSDLLTCGAGIVTVAGYFLAEMIIEKSVSAPLEGIMFNGIQALASAAVFLMFVNTVRRIHKKIQNRTEQKEQNEP